MLRCQSSRSSSSHSTYFLHNLRQKSSQKPSQLCLSKAEIFFRDRCTMWWQQFPTCCNCRNNNIVKKTKPTNYSKQNKQTTHNQPTNHSPHSPHHTNKQNPPNKQSNKIHKKPPALPWTHIEGKKQRNLVKVWNIVLHTWGVNYSTTS